MAVRSRLCDSRDFAGSSPGTALPKCRRLALRRCGRRTQQTERTPAPQIDPALSQHPYKNLHHIDKNTGLTIDFGSGYLKSPTVVYRRRFRLNRAIPPGSSAAIRPKQRDPREMLLPRHIAGSTIEP